ncbi:MAG: hypothetical protein M1827_007507 [Pycnora praestabilis]|nr:MAG: hypothetical protein M1827_007507 [Pycnora praestabilis]
MPARILGFRRAPTSSSSSLDEPVSTKQHTTESLVERRDSYMDYFDHHKRHSLAGKISSKEKSKAKGSPPPSRPKAARIEIKFESPPLVFYGPPAQSTGALLSGQLKVFVDDPEINLQALELAMVGTIETKRPVVTNCPDCARKNTNLKRWEFLKEPLTLERGEHSFPFSYLIPGHLPATSHGWLGVVDYLLSGKAVTEKGDELKFERPVNIQRAITPGPDKNSVRIFPPTKLTAHITLPPSVHPVGDFTVQMRLSGVVAQGATTQTRWRIRKINWRMEETSKMISPACSKHSNKVGGEGKGILHQDSRQIGEEELKSGWKTDFDTADGQIDMEFSAFMRPGSNPLCDVESPTGLTITHNLIIELIVAEEYCSNKNTKAVTPTGAARVLRMQFGTIVTERSGLGISWDEEQPPMYEDVPASPPTYIHVKDYEGPPLDYADLERMHLQ